MGIKLNKWQKKLLEEMPDKIAINSNRWSGKSNYYKALKKLKELKDAV